MNRIIKICTAAVLMVLGMNSYSQNMTLTVVDTVLPKKVVETFNKMYPKGSMEEWIQAGDTFTITYFYDNGWYDVSIGRKGNWISTSAIIDYDQLPEAVKNAFSASANKDKEIILVKIEEKQGAKKKIRTKTYLIYKENYKKEEVILRYNETGGNL